MLSYGFIRQAQRFAVSGLLVTGLHVIVAVAFIRLERRCMVPSGVFSCLLSLFDALRRQPLEQSIHLSVCLNSRGHFYAQRRTTYGRTIIR